MATQMVAKDERGSVLPVFALSLMAIVTLAAASIALGMDGRAANNLQNAADMSALSGATAFVTGTSPRAEDRLKEAQSMAAATAEANAEFVLTHLGVSAVSEDPYGQHTEIEVKLSFEPVNAAAKILGRNANIAIERTAAASATWGFPLCILSLSSNGTGVSTSGSTALVAENCLIWSNSESQNSMQFEGGKVEAKYSCTAGGAVVSGGAQVKPVPVEDCKDIPDPLKDWTAPAPDRPEALVAFSGKQPSSPNKIALLRMLEMTLSRPPRDSSLWDLKRAMQTRQPLPDSAVSDIATSLLDLLRLDLLGGNWINEDGVYTRGVAKGQHVLEVAQVLGIVDNVPESLYEDDTYYAAPTHTLNPGTYAGLDISEGHVKMQPGIYHIVDAPLIVRRRATLTGEGVTIILHGDDATFSVVDQARLTLTAPLDGPTAGMALAEDRHDRLTAGWTQRSRLTGSGTIEAIGTIYLPRQIFAITGNGAADQASPLLQIVASTVRLSDQGALDIDFDPEKTDVPAAIMPERTARLLR